LAYSVYLGRKVRCKSATTIITMSTPSWTVAIGADEAGFDYKKIIKADLEKDPRVKSVIDVGVNEGTDKTAYPHVGVAAARKVAEGKADRAIIICGTGMGVAISACKVPGIRVSHPHQLFLQAECRHRSHTIHSRSNGWSCPMMVRSSLWVNELLVSSWQGD
jgi:RpiB/LacA/LacB family sugar-phosphate isomerase